MISLSNTLFAITGLNSLNSYASLFVTTGLPSLWQLKIVFKDGLTGLVDLKKLVPLKF